MLLVDVLPSVGNYAQVGEQTHGANRLLFASTGPRVKWNPALPHPQAVTAPQQSNQFASDAYYISDQDAEKIIGPVENTDKEQLLLARVGQGGFRKRLVERWQSCSVLGCGPETVLVASHIVSWRTCKNNGERLSPNNGLLLSPNLDKLFDRRMISFSDQGILLFSLDIHESDAAALGVHPGMRLRRVPPGIVEYLARHREGKEWSELPAQEAY
ncbi:HNH endonuclease [Ralstonia pseudosolanacearum]|uniref:HNH endonuclease n=2 Tax=Ralstonia pseudosolanacearum TaxID=1310165 RepID=UPI002175B80E|nr:HNH endonuclease signature motif containing protein [Ralstonia pseudosolanacearum]UWD92022.1 HNH endonuclease [Ralstonia pseudosolanacearum]